MDVIAFLSASGGAGKTTIALHVAHRLLAEGRRVLLIDMDPSAGASTALLGEGKVEELEARRRTVGDALERFADGEAVELERFVEKVRLRDRVLDLVPSGDRLSDAMGRFWFSGNYAGPERKVREFIESSVRGYDVVLLDTLPFYERRYTITAFLAADKSVVVSHPYGVEPARTRRMVAKLVRAIPTSIDLKARVLINKVDPTTSEARRALELVGKGLSLPFFQTIIHQRVCYTRISEMAYVADKKGRQEIESFVGELRDWLAVGVQLM